MNMDFLENGISDLEFAKRFVAMADEVLATSSPDDFVINPEQMSKFNSLVEFFKTSAKELGGKVKNINVIPAFGVGDVTANFVVFDLSGEDIQKFCDVIRHCSALSIDITTDDELCISCTVPNVFVPKCE